ncbi:MAG: GNAT family N-acetyltransferase [Methylococcales bacterium]
MTACHVAISHESYQIAGFYTISAAQVSVTRLPDEVKKKLPRYPSVPAVRTGRLAVDEKFQRQGLGSTLLTNAVFRILHSDIAAFAVIVDAKDDKAMAFYRHHGFLDLNAGERTMFVSLSRFAKAFALFDA